MNNNQALKYEFRGFRLMRAEYNRMLDKPLTGFSFITKKNTFDEKNQICELITEIEVVFSTEICRFTFSSGFKIILYLSFRFIITSFKKTSNCFAL